MPAAVCVHVIAASPCVVSERETLATVVLAEADSSLAHIVYSPQLFLRLERVFNPLKRLNDSSLPHLAAFVYFV